MINIEQKYRNRYFLNDTSLFDEWGVIITKGGYAELLKEPQRKQGYSHVWLEANGTDRFVLPYYETRTVNLDFTFVCETLEEYLTKKTNLYEILKRKDLELDEDGYINLSSTTLNKTWKLLYNNTTSIEDLTDMYKGGIVVVKHTISFLDDNTEGENFDAQAYLVDENGEFLVNENDEFLTINL